VAVVVGLGLGYHFFWRYHLKRFQEVHAGTFYRTAQPSEFGLRWLKRHYGVRTIVSLQLFDPVLDRGLLDLGAPDGDREARYAPEIGLKFQQWPMGTEASWPWLTPWQFEAFFDLIDDPANLPIAVHCMGGRHRTGTLSALYRLEYDRWPVEQTLAEMYSFKFGERISMQEFNLKTYLPRHRPDATIWPEIRREFGPLLGVAESVDYETLVRGLAQLPDKRRLTETLQAYLTAGRPFALPLARRLIRSIEDPAVETATDVGSQTLARADALDQDWQAAAALIADFGTPSEQARLLELITAGSREPTVSRRYAALVAGATDRYTFNRLAYVRPLLEDTRWHTEPGATDCRYRDQGLARFGAIADVRLMLAAPPVEFRDYACTIVRKWYDDHPAALKLARRVPPVAKLEIYKVDGRGHEDLSRVQQR